MRKSWIRLTTYRREGREGKRESNKRRKAETENGRRGWKKESLRRETEMSIVTQDRVITRETHSLVGFVMSEMKSLRGRGGRCDSISFTVSSVPFCLSPSHIPLFLFFFFTHTTFHSKFVYVKYNNIHRREYEGREGKRGKRERKKVRRKRGIKIAFYFPSGNWSLLALLFTLLPSPLSNSLFHFLSFAEFHIHLAPRLFLFFLLSFSPSVTNIILYHFPVPCVIS